MANAERPKDGPWEAQPLDVALFRALASSPGLPLKGRHTIIVDQLLKGLTTLSELANERDTPIQETTIGNYLFEMYSMVIDHCAKQRQVLTNQLMAPTCGANDYPSAPPCTRSPGHMGMHISYDLKDRQVTYKWGWQRG